MDIDVESEDKTSRAVNIFPQVCGPFERSGDLLIGRVRKWGADGASFAGTSPGDNDCRLPVPPLHVLNIFLSEPPAAFWFYRPLCVR